MVTRPKVFRPGKPLGLRRPTAPPKPKVLRPRPTSRNLRK